MGQYLGVSWESFKAVNVGVRFVYLVSFESAEPFFESADSSPDVDL